MTVSRSFQATVLGILLATLPGCQRQASQEEPEWTPTPMAMATPEATPESALTPEAPSPTEAAQTPLPAMNPFGGGRETATPAATPAELAPLQGQGPIKHPVFSQDAQGKQEMREFPGDVPEVFLNLDIEAPRKAGTLKSVWVSDMVPTIRSVDSLSLKAGSQHVTLSMARPGAAWPPGTFQVDLLLADKSVARYAFAVGAASEPVPLPSPEGLPTPAPPSDARLSYVILSDEASKETLMQSFPATVTNLVVRIDTSKLPKGVPVEAAWKAQKVADIPAGYVFKQNRERATGVTDEDILFTLPPPPGKPFVAGDYQVDVMIARKTVWSCPFRVEQP